MRKGSIIESRENGSWGRGVLGRCARGSEASLSMGDGRQGDEGAL
ncbi:hypothetical protein ACHHV8_06580 [Paenibacillus sp. TAB 01]